MFKLKTIIYILFILSNLMFNKMNIIFLLNLIAKINFILNLRNKITINLLYIKVVWSYPFSLVSVICYLQNNSRLGFHINNSGSFISLTRLVISLPLYFPESECIPFRLLCLSYFNFLSCVLFLQFFIYLGLIFLCWGFWRCRRCSRTRSNLDFFPYYTALGMLHFGFFISQSCFVCWLWWCYWRFSFFVVFFLYLGVNHCRYGTKKVRVFGFAVASSSNILGFGCLKI